MKPADRPRPETPKPAEPKKETTFSRDAVRKRIGAYTSEAADQLGMRLAARLDESQWQAVRQRASKMSLSHFDPLERLLAQKLLRQFRTLQPLGHDGATDGLNIFQEELSRAKTDIRTALPPESVFGLPIDASPEELNLRQAEIAAAMPNEGDIEAGSAAKAVVEDALRRIAATRKYQG